MFEPSTSTHPSISRRAGVRTSQEGERTVPVAPHNCRILTHSTHSTSTHSTSTTEPGREPAVVWADADGRPVRLVWHGERWRVSDRPTLITEPVPWWSSLDPEGSALELAPLSCTGWRFQATAADGRSCVFDVRDDGDATRWLVVKVYT